MVRIPAQLMTKAEQPSILLPAMAMTRLCSFSWTMGPTPTNRMVWATPHCTWRPAPTMFLSSPHCFEEGPV
ncbi:similar to RIKEN cDNA C730048E16, isoform CRA_b [Rattus norvegicus]|uniref:Similar to RIKEN cDNA C730048E16, isoform CRA_b n=1 Tax=Rattus norvegicus TaxID=10116 RepID=A6HSP5_RAT|nr:similar to RIKEN cDNA C730048E16, isoform CRA_b [Rattus norvegicus]